MGGSFLTFPILCEANSIGYDPAGRVVWSIQPGGQMTTFSYDANSNITAIGSVLAGTDSDSDGIPDFFEIHFSGTVTALSPTADGDQDGLNNLGEFAFAFNPNASDAVNITPISIVTPSGSTDRFFTIVYQRPQVAQSLLSYTSEVSFDLSQTMPWSSDPADVQEISVVPMEGGVEQVTVRALAPVDDQDKLFLRIRINTL